MHQFSLAKEWLKIQLPSVKKFIFRIEKDVGLGNSIDIKKIFS